MRHAILAVALYVAFVVQLAYGSAWVEAGVAVNVVLLVALPVLLLARGTPAVVWGGLAGLLDDVLHHGPLGVGVVALVVAVMAVLPMIASRRTTTERLLVALPAIALVTAVSSLARDLVSRTVASPTAVLASSLHTLWVGTTLALLFLLVSVIVRRRRPAW